ncbi:MAG: zinc-dependent peptidase [Candidatus Cyclobacteriaceae bacterium M2_1C_046]
MYIALLAVLGFCVLIFYLIVRKRKIKTGDFPQKWRPILAEKVAFYQSLEEKEKHRFENELLKFLARVRVKGVKTEVDIEDKLLIASCAAIPIFSFKNWEYTQLNEVLLYPDRFNEAFSLTDENRRVTGMVGSGIMDDVMILSRPALKKGFENTTDKKNVAIHEFIHLIDKEDGEIDGVPEILLGQQYVIPWMRLMKDKTDEILNSRSDLNPYGATKPEEFFAVASEYFFERPKLLKKKHPKLYTLLKKIFQQDMASRLKNIFKSRKKIGRNDPCPCGSGEKFKYCCMD